MTKAEVIFEGYQLPEDPSVPYEPSNVWDTMSMIEGVQVFGHKPEKTWRTSRGEGQWEDPLFYHATFHFAKYEVTVLYQWLHPSALLVALGDERRFDDVRDLIFSEHRRLDEKLQEKRRRETIESKVK